MMLVAWLLACQPAAPWRDATAEAGAVQGRFRAVVGSEWPGEGWVGDDDFVARDAARAAVLDVGGARDRVVVIEIRGWDDDGWTVLELDAAASRWAAGRWPIDGEAIIGSLTTPDGSVRWLVDGEIHLVYAGVADGDVVEGTFRSALAEAP